MDQVTISQATTILEESHSLNPGPWMEHSINVAKAAQNIAELHPGMDSERAYIFGLLHDIGRRFGKTHMRHILDGYRFLMEAGFGDAARICLTHSFPFQNINAVFGNWDCTSEEFEFIREFLENTKYSDYDKLIQLCDALALPSGFCLLEKRMVDVALRYGTNEYTVDKWKAVFGLKSYFENIIGRSIYNVLPGAVENTFEFDLAR